MPHFVQTKSFQEKVYQLIIAEDFIVIYLKLISEYNGKV